MSQSRQHSQYSNQSGNESLVVPSSAAAAGDTHGHGHRENPVSPASPTALIDRRGVGGESGFMGFYPFGGAASWRGVESSTDGIREFKSYTKQQHQVLKSDIDKVRTEMCVLRQELQHQIENLRRELQVTSQNTALKSFVATSAMFILCSGFVVVLIRAGVDPKDTASLIKAASILART